ncbi:MAG: TIGR00730 family Rossman fold protein [Alphaproteobacteria bacterium]
MVKLDAVVVFCGSHEGTEPVYVEQAYRMGSLLAQNHIKLIYGAGGKGLMGAVAKGALDHNGYVIGATIRSLYEIEKSDVVETALQKFEVWDKMSSRKVSMTKQTDAICVLPGGLGTLDELFEVAVLRQIQISDKPIVIVNINGFYNGLRRMLQEMSTAGFIRPHQLDLMTFVETVDEVLPVMRRELAAIETKEKK